MRLSTKGRYAVVAMIDLTDCCIASSWRAPEDPAVAMRWAAIPSGSRWPTSSGPSMIPTPVPNGITTAAARTQLPVASWWTSFGHASTRR